jgi:thioredoxin 1
MITEIVNKDALIELLKQNKGIVVLKFGAEWCGPCKNIEYYVKNQFDSMSENVTTGIIDVDDNFELYAFLKKKKMIQTIPAILRYDMGNESYIPDDMISSSNTTELDVFFENIRKNN